MNWDILWNSINENLVQYVTGSYWMLAFFWIIGIFSLIFLMDLGLKYALIFSMPVGLFFVAIGWFNGSIGGQYWNLLMVVLGLFLGLVLLKWIGDW